MKIILAAIIALSFFGSIAHDFMHLGNTPGPVTTKEMDNDAQLKTSLPAKEKSPVLIELFTSEGCSSCPPADKNLIYLNEKQPFPEAEAITLSMHVDYWNRLGWTDPFSAAQFSQRQGFYSNTFGLDGVYTPQMVVDGGRQFVGGNLDEARKSISEAANAPKADVELSISANKLLVRMSNLPEHTFSNVFAAIAEDNLSTAVRNGENGGRTLNHDAVVRVLKTIGTIADRDSSFEAETTFQLQPGWKKQNLKFVVFAQVEKGSRIIGVGQIKLQIGGREAV